MPFAASARSSALPSVSGRRLRVLSAAVAMGLGLAACGGGTQVSKFTPNKIVSFGDELSFLGYLGEQTVQGQVIKGQKYGVNYLVTDYAYYTGTTYESDKATTDARALETYSGAPTYAVDSDSLRFIKSEASSGDATHLRQTRTLWGCSIEGRLWMQILANGYGLGYATGCPADKGGAVTYATVGAKTADVIAQLNAHKGELTSSTLATVLAGQNDIIEQLAIYRATPGQLATIKATLKSRGEQLGQAVNSLLASGGRVLIVTPPDLGKAPGAGSDGAALTEMTQAFVDGFTGINGVLNDGNKIGLVKAFDLVQAIHANPSSYALNVLERACDMTGRFKVDGITATTSLLDCTYSSTVPVNSTLVPGATMYTHLWASDWVLAPGGQARIGSLAYSRATANPF
jgi:outer membrane lipase/esterase